MGCPRLEVGGSPSAASLFEALLLLIVVRVEESTLRLICVLVGEAGVQHLGVLCAKG